MLPNVKQNTIAPLIKRTIAKGTVVYTDEYDIYGRLTEWGYPHHTVCHSAREFARDEDGDGFCEIHVNTIEGFWSLLRSWLRPHRGVSQEKLPLYLGLFEFVHTVRKRGTACWVRRLNCYSRQPPETQDEPKRFAPRGFPVSGLSRQSDHAISSISTGI